MKGEVFINGKPMKVSTTLDIKLHSCYDCKYLHKVKPYIKKRGYKTFGTVQSYCCKALRRFISCRYFDSLPLRCGSYKE